MTDLFVMLVGPRDDLNGDSGRRYKEVGLCANGCPGPRFESRWALNEENGNPGFLWEMALKRVCT